MKPARILLLLVSGFAGFVAFLAYRDAGWRREHEALAHELCDSIPVGTPAPIAKERARAIAKAVTEVEVKDLSIRAVFLNPYSPGDRVFCEANIWNDKIVNNQVRVEN
jgi:hypothetical protein